MIDLTVGKGQALIKLPYEMLPLPSKGQKVKCLNRVGEEVAEGEITSVTEPSKDKTYVLSVLIPKDKADDIRAVKVQ